MLEHHLGDVPANPIVDSLRPWHHQGRHVQRHDLVADQLVDERLGEENLLRVGVEAAQLRRSPRAGVCNSDSEVNPRRSANSTPISIVIPPGGAASTQTAQRFGFLRDGRKPRRPTTRAPMPANGAPQYPQRGELGIARENTLERPVAALRNEPPIRLPVSRRQRFVGTLAGLLCETLQRLPLHEGERRRRATVVAARTRVAVHPFRMPVRECFGRVPVGGSNASSVGSRPVSRRRWACRSSRATP